MRISARMCGRAGSITSIESAVIAISPAISVTNSAKRGMLRAGAAGGAWAMGGGPGSGAVVGGVIAPVPALTRAKGRGSGEFYSALCAPARHGMGPGTVGAPGGTGGQVR